MVDAVPRGAARASGPRRCPAWAAPFADGTVRAHAARARRRRRLLRRAAAARVSAAAVRPTPFVIRSPLVAPRGGAGRRTSLTIRRFAILLVKYGLLAVALAGHRRAQRAHHDAGRPHVAGGPGPVALIGRTDPGGGRRGGAPPAAAAGRGQAQRPARCRRTASSSPGARPPGSTLKTPAQHPGVGEPGTAAADGAGGGGREPAHGAPEPGAGAGAGGPRGGGRPTPRRRGRSSCSSPPAGETDTLAGRARRCS